MDTLAAAGGGVDRGAHLAIRLRLAGLYAWGVSHSPAHAPRLGPAARETLDRAGRQEAADDLMAAREIRAVLSAIAGLRPVVFKGRALALSVWPRPAFRPAGDLDLLIEPEGIDHAIRSLEALGYRPVADERHSRLRVPRASIQLVPRNGARLVIDLHSRLFRSVGRRLDMGALLARCRPATLEEQPIRKMDEADRLLVVLVHMAKHGFVRMKWLLDLHALALRADGAVWREAAARASCGGVGRSLFSAMTVAASLPGVSPDTQAMAQVRPPYLIRRSLEALVTRADALREDNPPLWKRYAFELLYEPSLGARLRMAAGLLARRARFQ